MSDRQPQQQQQTVTPVTEPEAGEGLHLSPPAFQLSAAGGKNGTPQTSPKPSPIAQGPIQAKSLKPPPFQLKAEGEGETTEKQTEGGRVFNSGAASAGADAGMGNNGGGHPIQRMLHPGIVQRKGEKDSTTAAAGEYSGIVIDIAKSKAVDFAWDYWDQLKKQYSLKDHLAKLLERAAMYLIDCGVRVTGIGAYLTAMNPYLEILKAVKTIIETIPKPIRVFLGYAIGYGLKKFSDKNMSGAIKEKHLNILLIEGGDIMASVGTLIDFLYDLGHNPVQTVYRGIWAAVRYYTGNDEIDSMTGFLSHLENKGKEKTGYSGSRFREKEGQDERTGKDPAAGNEKAKKDNLFNADLGFFWVRMGQPKLERWNDEKSKEERGGLVIDGGMGLKVFGQAMGTDNIELKLPYSGDWEMNFRDLMILSEPIALGNFFRGGPVSMPRLRLKSGVGVDYMQLKLLDFVFGNDVFIAKELGMTYSASDKKLAFSGDTIMNFFGHTLLGRFNLDVGTDGKFHGGYVDIVLPEKLDLIKDRLSIANLNFIGKWGEEGLELLELAGDIDLNVSDKFDFDATRTAIRYQNGEFMGLVDRVSVLVPLGANSFVELSMDKGQIGREGFKADKIMLKFFYGDEETQGEHEGRLRGDKKKEKPQVKQEDIQSIIPGFNLDWVDATGLDTLVVSASASGISVGADGFKMDGDLEKKLHKFAASLFGVKAKFDGDRNEGSLEGKWKYKVPNIPALNFDFPIVPGINAGVGIGANLEMGAELNGSLRKLPHAQKDNIHPWEVGGYAGLYGKANVNAHFDVSAGHPLLVSVHAGLFGEAGAELAADAALHGVVNWDEDAHRISLSDKEKERPSASFDMHADLTASLGAQIKAKAFHIFEVTLWEYKFLKWDMGLWRAKGRLEAKEDGGYDYKFEQSGFEGGLPSRKPEIDFKVARTEDVILERERQSDKISDPMLFWRLVHDVVDPTQGMDQATRRIMLEKLRRLNDTGDSLEGFIGTTTESMASRTDESSDSYSFLMTEKEWVEYSMVRGWFGPKSRGKEEKKIDSLIKDYHKTKDSSRKKDMLINLIDSVIPEYLHEGHSRDSMVAKLHGDAKRELARLKSMEKKAQEVQSAEPAVKGAK